MPQKDGLGRIRLTPAEKQELEGMGSEMLDLENEIKRAKRAGLEVDTLEEEFMKAKKLRDGLLREYS